MILLIRSRRTAKLVCRMKSSFAGKDGLDKALKSRFALCSLCTYSGRRRTAKNAYKLYGFIFDLDGVGEEQCNNLLWGISMKRVPCPQYIVNSGHGLHLYYLFEQPVPLYPNVIDHLQRLKHGLTREVWTNDTSYIRSKPGQDNRDYLGIYQNFRMPGSCTKIGKGNARTKYPVRAYRYNSYTGARCSISYLNQFVEESWRAPEDPDYSSWDYEGVTLDEAKELYPEWYQKRIVEKLPPGKWRSNKALYDWWLDRIQHYGGDWGDEGAKDGNRYYCIAILFIMAIKCDIPFDAVMADALDLVEPFDELTEKPDNAFLVSDVENASKYYKRSYARFSIKAIEAKTGFHIKRREPPKYTRQEAMTIARTIRDVRDKDGSWRNQNGAPTKEQTVKEWRAAHPDGRKIDCERETGLSRHTVLKWWK